MNIAIFLNSLGLGGSEKAACRWAEMLRERGHAIEVLSLADGPRRAELEKNGIALRILRIDARAIRDRLRELGPDVIHAHAPGQPHVGDILGEALRQLPKIPVVQTNIFGRFENPKEDFWTDFRLFISWTSCVQAARRGFCPLNDEFFRRTSVAVYPLEPNDGPGQAEIEIFRQKHGVKPDEFLFGRISRPEPNKWTDLPIESFRRASRRRQGIKLLLREPPSSVRIGLAAAPDRNRFVILPSTSDPAELALTMASLNAVLHTSVMGESFGYGIAEPMNFAKPVIANSTPWADQAQIELVRHGEGGFIAGTAHVVSEAMLALANDADLCRSLGRNAQSHIRKLADPTESTNRLEAALRTAVGGTENPGADEDLRKARDAARYLDEQQFGHTWQEHLALRPFHFRVRFHQLRRHILSRFLDH